MTSATLEQEASCDVCSRRFVFRGRALCPACLAVREAPPLETAPDHLVVMAEAFVERGAQQHGAIVTPEFTRWVAEKLVDERRRARLSERDARVAVDRAVTEHTRLLVLTAAADAECERLAGLVSRELDPRPWWRLLRRRS